MKGTLVALGAVFVLSLVLVGASYIYYSSAMQEAARLESAYAEAVSLRADFDALSQRVARVEKKVGITGIQGILRAVDEVFAPLGLKEKVKSVKLLPSKDEAGEMAEVAIQGMDLNEAVNALYFLESGPMPLVIKKISMRASFENPGRLNTTMTLLFVKSGK